MAESRRCERCGKEFEPLREHARFCSARCRVAWNRDNWNRINREQERWGSENWADPESGTEAEKSALGWAITAMHDTTERLGKVKARDRAQAFAVIGEAVWWVTIVDATLVRYHPDEYEAALAGLSDACREQTVGTFTGLRFVRNRMGYYTDHADFIRPAVGSDGTGDAPISEWTWRHLPPPAAETLPVRGQEWELSRYEAYQDWLAGRAAGDIFEVATDFLALAARTVPRDADSGGQAASAQ